MDSSVISVGRHRPDIPTAVICYDLIPILYPDRYLQNPTLKCWYHERLHQLRRADQVLAISASSRLEAIAHVGLDPEMVSNISSAVDHAQFRPVSVPEAEAASVRARYALQRPFVLYTGAEDARKNLDGFVRGWALVEPAVRRAHMAVIACRLPPELMIELRHLAADHGLAPDELVLTGFVPEPDLLALYNLCTLFVFPSWHEGFGLPALEAMACGAPTIAARTSSLPEVLGLDTALFDPHSDADIARAIQHALTDAVFLAGLRAHALVQAGRFSWADCARRAIAALEVMAARRQLSLPRLAVPWLAPRHSPGARPRLAYVSPMPPAFSGIADYSAALLPELARHYEIDVIVHQDEPVRDDWTLANAPVRNLAWFEQHASLFDRVVYQMGNSPLHAHMLELIPRVPGTVVLHDFFLSSMVAHHDASGERPGLLDRMLQRSHGWSALQARHTAESVREVVRTYPCNLPVLLDAHGVVCHSEHARTLAADWFGSGFADDWTLIPLLRQVNSARATAPGSAGAGAAGRRVRGVHIRWPRWHQVQPRADQGLARLPARGRGRRAAGVRGRGAELHLWPDRARDGE